MPARISTHSFSIAAGASCASWALTLETNCAMGMFEVNSRVVTWRSASCQSGSWPRQTNPVAVVATSNIVIESRVIILKCLSGLLLSRCRRRVRNM